MNSDAPVTWKIGAKNVVPELLSRESDGRMFVSIMDKIHIIKAKVADSGVYRYESPFVTPYLNIEQFRLRELINKIREILTVGRKLFVFPDENHCFRRILISREVFT